MDPILWFPIGAIVLGVLIGARMASRSAGDLSAGGGAAIGAFIGLMATFPLLALGLSHI